MFRILGSGYEGPEEKDIPIDIPAHKLLGSNFLRNVD